jgi:putative FmdB family regulatory protein
MDKVTHPHYNSVQHEHKNPDQISGKSKMPIYEYEHMEVGCELGKRFEIKQSMKDPVLKKCPNCKKIVKRNISLVGISVAKSNSELRDLGFTKLVRRDDGVYENVTARKGDSRYMERDKPETIPDLSKIISS